MTVIVVIAACLVVIAALVAAGAYLQYHRYHGKYLAVARALCEPGSFRISFLVRTLLLSGKVGGRVMRYGVFGDERMGPVSSYLLLECPARGNFRFYHGGDIALLDPPVRGAMAALTQNDDFRGLFVTSDRTPFCARLITRPLGFSYKPGLFLWKWEKAAFDPETIRTDLERLADLADSGV